MTSRPGLSGALVAVFATVLLIFAWMEAFAPATHSGFTLIVRDDGAGHVVVRKKDPDVAVALGDQVDLGSLTFPQRFRLQTGSPPGTSITVRILHNGVWAPVSMKAKAHPVRPTFVNLTLLAFTTLALVVFAIIGVRRPSIGTAALVFLAASLLNAPRVASIFSWLPDSLYAPTATVIVSLLTEFPIFAVLVFLTRFPRNPEQPKARLRMRIGDGIVIAAIAPCTFFTLAEPVVFQTFAVGHYTFQIVGIITGAFFAITAYREASGEDRQRIGWVLVGLMASDVSLIIENVAYLSWPSATVRNVLFLTSYVLSAVLPLSLGYAVLRYRVIDLGFVVNRTLVYAVVTALIVVVVSFVDWISGKLINETRLALAAEAGVTILLGVTLNTVHSRIERIVDRLVFRQRYLAERKLRNRLDALSFATSDAAIDAALTDEIVDILRLRSAAVFRVNSEDGAFVRRRSVAWTEADGHSFDCNSLIVRSIRAADKPFFLADLGVSDFACPRGDAMPMLAVPVATQKDFVGFALYGGVRDGTAPDPEIVAHLAELSAAAATTYALVEARKWRERYFDLQRAIEPQRLIVE